jgi:hypothetical protein
MDWFKSGKLPTSRLGANFTFGRKILISGYLIEKELLVITYVLIG